MVLLLLRKKKFKILVGTISPIGPILDPPLSIIVNNSLISLLIVFHHIEI